jgi:hypothetical protein
MAICRIARVKGAKNDDGSDFYEGMKDKDGNPDMGDHEWIYI